MQERQHEEEIFTDKMKKRKSTNKQPNFIPEGTRKRRTKFKFSKKEGNNKHQSRRNRDQKDNSKDQRNFNQTKKGEDTKSEIDITTDNTGTLRIVENYYE